MHDRASQTAEAVCLMRAREHLRAADQRIVDDSFAQFFLSPAGRMGLAAAAGAPHLADAAQRLSSGLWTFVLARHRVLDDWLARDLQGGSGQGSGDGSGDGRVEQLVVLGAGYDTRAWRFADALQGRPVFEVDHPATARRKSRVVAGKGQDWPRVNRKVVECDFQVESVPTELVRAGFDPGLRTAWIWEGVTMYLRRAAVDRTLRDIATHSAAGSSLGMDLWFLLDDPDLRASFLRASASLLSVLGEPITFGLHPDDAEDFLARRGLRLEASVDAAELQRGLVSQERAVYPALWCCRARVLG